MKIDVEKGADKPFLPDGRHEVEITDIQEGSSEYKDVPFFACRFENEDGFVNQRFYLSGPGMPILMGLFKAVGIEAEEGKQLDTKQLLHKKVSIEVGERSYEAPETGNERTLKQAYGFQPVRS
ncbi:hypothetical protein [Tellurirhabdus rosea]|uniref:hypothetical protein n=1 Tax=Tellurirhabdus rosea TaxID=2674997 RepID=UPI00224E8FE3|nr:hypothetical protein [Tellurirhabdus rosea]